MDTTDLTIDGQEVKLTPTVNALDIINKYFGGMQPAYAKIAILDLDAYATILFVGEENRLPKDDKEKQKVKQSVFEFGLVNLMVPLIDYLGLLTSGGKRKVLEDDEDTNPKM